MAFFSNNKLLVLVRDGVGVLIVSSLFEIVEGLFSKDDIDTGLL